MSDINLIKKIRQLSDKRKRKDIEINLTGTNKMNDVRELNKLFDHLETFDEGLNRFYFDCVNRGWLPEP